MDENFMSNSRRFPQDTIYRTIEDDESSQKVFKIMKVALQ